MMEDDTKDWEKSETIDELDNLLRIAQEMGHRLSCEVHGDLYDDVRVLTELLHKTRNQADLVQQKLKPK
ncbi:MAG: hypothetical protein Q8L39_08415 [Burkholderiales bacterium]|nr:hypothetical protein [Burkholderiales bacterium]